MRLAWLLFGLLAAGCKCGKPATPPPALPFSERIVFIAEHDEGPQLSLREADGGITELTHGPAWHFPTDDTSTDAMTVVAVDSQTKLEQLFELSLSSRALTPLTEPSPRARNPIRTSDGLLFESGARELSNLALRLADGGLEFVTSSEEGDFEPQRRGDGVVFCSSRGGNPDLFELRPDGGVSALTSDVHEDTSPRVSADGSVIVFLSNRSGVDAPHVLQHDGKERRLFEAASKDLHLTADGKQAFFTFRKPNGRSGVGAVFVTSGAFTALTDERSPFDDELSDVSRDGRWLLFTSTRSGAAPDVYAVRTDGTQVTRLTNALTPDWGAKFVQR